MQTRAWPSLGTYLDTSLQARALPRVTPFRAGFLFVITFDQDLIFDYFNWMRWKLKIGREQNKNKMKKGVVEFFSFRLKFFWSFWKKFAAFQGSDIFIMKQFWTTQLKLYNRPHQMWTQVLHGSTNPKLTSIFFSNQNATGWSASASGNEVGHGKSCSTTKPRPTTPELKNRVLHPAYHPPGEDWKRTWLYSSSIFQQIASHHFSDAHLTVELHPTKHRHSKAPASRAKKSRSSESTNDGLSKANKGSLSS